MSSSCCSMEASCEKKRRLRYVNAVDRGVRRSSGAMAAGRLILGGGFLALLLWVEQALVEGLVDEKVSLQLATTTGYQSTQMMPRTYNATHGNVTVQAKCGNNSVHCPIYCNFCDHPETPLMSCLQFLLEHMCLQKFENGMESLNSTDWCVWRNVSGFYSNLSHCTEEISDCLQIPWPNPLVEEIFVDIHTRFFMDCPTEELSDPPPAFVFALVITPICLIPVLVSLVVLKTKNGDGSS